MTTTITTRRTEPVRGEAPWILKGHDKNDDGDSDGGSGTTNPQDGDHWEDEDDEG